MPLGSAPAIAIEEAQVSAAIVGRRGSKASARRARAWYAAAVARRNRRKADRGTPPPDRTRKNKCRAHVWLARDPDVECRCEFLCRGCNRWTHVDDGGAEHGPAAYACSGCWLALDGAA